MKPTIMRVALMAAAVSADPYDKLNKLANHYAAGMINEEDYNDLKSLVVEQIKKAEMPEAPVKSGRRSLASDDVAKSKCLANMVNQTAKDVAMCKDAIGGQAAPALVAILQYLKMGGGGGGGGGGGQKSFQCSDRKSRRSLLHITGQVNQEEILDKYWNRYQKRDARALSDIQEEFPGIPDSIANYRDDSGCIVLVGAGDTTQKKKYQVGGDLTNRSFDSCASACMRSEECVAISYAAKAKRCEMFNMRFYELQDANHVVMKTSDGSLWYDNVCVNPSNADPCDVLDNLNALQVAFHSYHLAKRVNGYGSNVCSDAKAIDSAAGFTFYQVKPNDNNVMTTANVIKRCKACGLRPACYTYRAGHTYNHPDCDKVDKYFDAVGYPSGGKNGHKELQRILAKRICGSDNVGACGNKGKLTSCAAIRNWSSGSACCSKGGWCNPGNNDRPSSGYLDLCAYIPGRMSGYSNTRS